MAEDTVSSEHPHVISREDARKLGLTRFCLGPDQPCQRGHVSERLVSAGTCIECTKLSVAAYRSRNPEKKKKWASDSWQANKEKRMETHRRWLKNNPEKTKEYSRKWREKNKGYMAAYWAKNKLVLSAKQKERWAKNYHRYKIAIVDYYHSNSARFRQYAQNRRARVRGAEGRTTREDIERIHKSQKGRCAHCRKKLPLNGSFHRDHIIPLAKGGSNWPSNIQILCQPCNQSKKDKDPIDHMRSLGLLL